MTLSFDHLAPDVSVVVPVFNESESVPHLLDQIATTLRPGTRFEIILVDDGSTDATWDAILALAPLYPELVALRLGRNYGQTAGLMAGIDASRGAVVVTMDGDLQNDPADMPDLIGKVHEGYEIVSGWRKQRRDKWLSRRLPSLIANAMIRRVAHVPIHDQGCALKAYRGELVRSISLYSDFHRFVVPLTQMGGSRIAEVETNHRAREFGKSKYGISRTFKVMADLVTLVMVTRHMDGLLPWLLKFAILPVVLAVIATAWTMWIGLQPGSLNLTVPIGATAILIQASLAIVAFGILAERMRHLAPAGWRSSERWMARIREPGSTRTTAVLIRDGEVLRFGEEVQ